MVYTPYPRLCAPNENASYKPHEITRPYPSLMHYAKFVPFSGLWAGRLIVPFLFRINMPDHLSIVSSRSNIEGLWVGGGT